MDGYIDSCSQSCLHPNGPACQLPEVVEFSRSKPVNVNGSYLAIHSCNSLIQIL